MANFLRSIGTSFTQLWNRQENLSLTHVRASKLHYVLAYTFELMLYNLGDLYILGSVPVFGVSCATLMYIGHVILSLTVMLLWSEHFRSLIRISTVVVLVGFIPFFFVPDGLLKSVFIIIAWTGMGGCVTAARCGFAFAANNAERMVGILLAFSATAAFLLLKGLNAQGPALTCGLPLALLTGMVLMLNLFKEDDLEAKADSKPSDSKAVFIAMAYMVAYYAVDGYAWRLIDTSNFGFILAGVGALCAIGLFTILHSLFKKSLWHIWNLFFTFAIIMALLAMFSATYDLFVPSQLFIGLSMIGYPASLYMLGCVQRRFASYKLLKQCTVLFAVLLPITTLSDDIIAGVAPRAISFSALLLTLAIFIGFTMAAPVSYKHLFSTIWMEDLRKEDMSRIRERIERAGCFEHYGLTPREKEVVELLLLAHTVRMIAGELKISQSTVNMHAANLYRKLHINSKAELFMKFGVAEEAESKG